MYYQTFLDGDKIFISYELSKEEINLLKHLKEYGYREFKRNDSSEFTEDLVKYGFVEYNDMAWHETLVLTELGEDVAKLY